jgi:protein SCO1/2
MPRLYPLFSSNSRATSIATPLVVLYTTRMSTDIRQPAWVADLQPPRWLWYLLSLLPFVVVAAFLLYQSTQVLPRISLAPGFSLIDQDGKRLTNEALRGSLVIYNFTQTRCSAPCRETSHTFQQIQKALTKVETGDIPVQFVTISYDLVYDTPEVLRGYANRLGADTSRWHFVSGDMTQLRNILHVGFQTETSPTEDGSFMVEPTFALVDGWGIVRALYRTATPDIELLRHDLQLVVREAQQSTGVNHYAYEAVHLFMCHNGM